jgi:hypothetical protein
MERKTPIDKARESIPYLENQAAYERENLIEQVQKHAKKFRDQAETFERIAKRMTASDDPDTIVRCAEEVAHDVAWFTANLGTDYLLRNAAKFEVASERLELTRTFTAPEATKTIPLTNAEMLNELILLGGAVKVRGKYARSFYQDSDWRVWVTFRHRKGADGTPLSNEETNELLSRALRAGIER